MIQLLINGNQLKLKMLH